MIHLMTSWGHSFLFFFQRLKSEETPPKRKRNTGTDTSQFLLRKLEIDREMKGKEFELRRDESQRREQEEERRREREQREEERRRREEERRQLKEERDEERRRRDDMERDRKFDLLQEQLLKQNQMMLLLLSKQKEWYLAFRTFSWFLGRIHRPLSPSHAAVPPLSAAPSCLLPSPPCPLFFEWYLLLPRCNAALALLHVF